MNLQGLKIGEVGQRSGVSVESIRYYEREGLLPRPPRTHTGYRVYGPEAVGRLRFIRQARDLGLSLQEIKDILSLSEAGRTPCCRVRELLGKELADLNRRIHELIEFRDRLQAFLERLEQVPDQEDASDHVCRLIELAPANIVAPQSGPHRSSDSVGNRANRKRHRER